MARILFLTQVLPYPLDAGPKVRAYYMLRHLADNHEVTLVSFVRPDDKPEYVEHLRQIAHALHTVPMRRSFGLNLRAVVKGMLSRLPIVIARDEMPEMTALLRRLTSETAFDLIHADQLSMAYWGQLAAQPSTLQPRLSSKPASQGPPSTLHLPHTLLDEHNAIYRLTERMAAESSGIRRAITQREARAFRRYEAEMIRAYDALLAVTEEDRQLLLALFDEPERSRQASKFTIVPICVAPERVRLVGKGLNDESGVMNADSGAISAFITPLSSFSPPTILHLGTMFWPPNVTGVLWFAREVLPLIWATLPETRFVVVGKNPPPAVQTLAADPRIQVAGYVADPLPYLQNADVFVVPLFSGGGMRVKILDAWLWGLPIVSTPLGAEGIDLRDGENILLAGDAASFAEATVRLLTDPLLNHSLRTQGRAWVELVYDWNKVYARVDVAYEQILGEVNYRDTKG